MAFVKHPFIYGRPVVGEEFWDREADLNTIYERLRKQESTIVIGGPHIGRTSLLLKLKEEGTKEGGALVRHLGEEVRVKISFMNLHDIPRDYDANKFWKEVLSSFGYAGSSLDETRDNIGDRKHLENVFQEMNYSNWHPILLLDEFERLLYHPNFRDFAFFATLRSLAQQRKLSMVIATRLTVEKLNEESLKLPESEGSPVFNFAVPCFLKPFEDISIEKFLDRTDLLSPDDRRFIRLVAGCHPYLLQAMAANVVEASGADRLVRASRRFYEQTAHHFDETWRCLGENSRTVVLILSLAELGGYVGNQRFAFHEIKNIEKFSPELDELARYGLVEQVNEVLDGKNPQGSKRGCILQGKRWRIASQSFLWWVRDVVVTKVRQLPSYEDWLTDHRYRSIVTDQQWNGMVRTARGVAELLRPGIDILVQILLRKLLTESADISMP